MRRFWIAPVLLAVALVLQLTVIDGLHLPHGGVPDLVLVLVVALAMADGPVLGMVTGFAVGLCADIAPPGSPFIGQYALIFCLAGWAAGSLGRYTKRSPLRALAVAVVVIAGAEAVAAGLGKMLEPDQVSVALIREFLPITIAYDLVLCPFVLYLVILVSTTQASRAAASPLAGTGLLSVPGRSKQAGSKRRLHVPRLDPAAARAGDGWVGRHPGRHPGSMRPASRGIRLHPGIGVPGSASGYAPPTSLQARPVKLRLSHGRRGDAAIGGVGGSSLSSHGQAGRHPGMLAGSGHQIRFGGELGGSAARHQAPAAHGRKPLRIDFRGQPGGSGTRRQGPAPARRKPLRIDFRGRFGGSGALRQAPPATGKKPLRIDFRGRLGGTAGRQLAPVGPRPKPLRINFSAHSGGSIAGTRALTAPSLATAATPRLRFGASRSALAMSPRATPARSVPSLHFHTAPKPIARRPAATPKFRRSGGLWRSSAPATGLAAGGAFHQGAFRAPRKSSPSRLRLSGRGRGLGMLGGSGQSALRRPPTGARKQPQFGYGRRSLLSFLTRRRWGGRWLARQRAGRRSGTWLIGKRTGGLR